MLTVILILGGILLLNYILWSMVRSQTIREELNIAEKKMDEYRHNQMELESKLAEANRKLQEPAAQHGDMPGNPLDQLPVLEQIAREQSKGFPLVAEAYADYFNYKYKLLAQEYDRHYYPDTSFSDQLRQITREKWRLQREHFILRKRIQYYESLFPSLPEYSGSGLEEELRGIGEGESQEAEQDVVRRYLTEEEYGSLDELSRDQTALERFLAGKRSPRQTARDYRRWIGYLYELDGFTVNYAEAIPARGHDGVQLICGRNGYTVLVGCVTGQEEKEVHVDHVMHLFRTSVKYFFDQYPRHSATGIGALINQQILGIILWTPGRLSDTARDYARKLHVSFEEHFKESRDYPMIKCTSTQEAMLYHLPFDSQYDFVRMEIGKGDRYVATVREAVEAGFRRLVGAGGSREGVDGGVSENRATGNG